MGAKSLIPLAAGIAVLFLIRLRVRQGKTRLLRSPADYDRILLILLLGILAAVVLPGWFKSHSAPLVLVALIFLAVVNLLREKWYFVFAAMSLVILVVLSPFLLRYLNQSIHSDTIGDLLQLFLLIGLAAAMIYLLIKLVKRV